MLDFIRLVAAIAVSMIVFGAFMWNATDRHGLIPDWPGFAAGAVKILSLLIPLPLIGLAFRSTHLMWRAMASQDTGGRVSLVVVMQSVTAASGSGSACSG